jgi:biotin carboxyl carrier protein
MKMNVTVANQTMEVEIEDLNTRPILARIGNETFEVWPEETTAKAQAKPAAPAAPAVAPRPAAAPAASASPAAAVSGNVETAPLPGVIAGITVKAGAAVKPGQELLDIEAMKMKNTIRASREGVVAEILVSVGDSVRHGQALVKYA